MRLITFTLAGVCALALLADEALGYYPEQVPLEDVRVDAMLGIAHDFWQDRSMPATCDERVEHAPSLLDRDGVDAEGRAVQGECTAVLRSYWVKWHLTTMRDRSAPIWVRRLSVNRACAVIVHEVGHLRGGRHQESPGVMDAHASVTPWECVLLARALVPRNSHGQVTRNSLDRRKGI